MYTHIIRFNSTIMLKPWWGNIKLGARETACGWPLPWGPRWEEQEGREFCDVLDKDLRNMDTGTGLGMSAGPNLVLSERGRYWPRTLTGGLLIFWALRRETPCLPLGSMQIQGQAWRCHSDFRAGWGGCQHTEGTRVERIPETQTQNPEGHEPLDDSLPEVFPQLILLSITQI